MLPFTSLYIVFCCPKFDAEAVFGLMAKHKITIFGGVPTMYWGLLNYMDEKFDYVSIAKNLRRAVSGGAALPVQVLEDFKNVLMSIFWKAMVCQKARQL